jgi:hypothetical protein
MIATSLVKGQGMMAVRVSNEHIERYYFESFLEICPLTGCVTYGDKPDVIVSGPRKIGIEITNFFLQSGCLRESEQRQRPLRSRVIAEAHSLYRAGGGKNIELTFVFDKNNPITSGRTKKIRNELVAFVRNIDDAVSGEIRKSLFRDRIPEISFIWLHKGECREPKWRLQGAYSTDLMRKDSLEALVRNKESKLREYNPCDAYWLLIVADSIDAAQDQEIRIDDPLIASDVFERIIIYDPAFKILVRANEI